MADVPTRFLRKERGEIVRTTFTIAKEIHETMKVHKEINWSAVTETALRNFIQEHTLHA